MNTNLINLEPNSERWLNIENLPNEEWKDIKDFEGLYQVSNYGRIKRLGYFRNHISSNQVTSFNVNYFIKEHIMKLKKDRYFRVQLYHSSNDRELFLVHRLVAEHFIDNPHNKLYVDHMNKNTYDNRVNNLQWVTSSENAKYSYNRGRERKCGKNSKQSKFIGQYDLDNNLISTYYGSGEASRATGIEPGHIRSCCRGCYGCKTAGGFIWKYL